jgi:hypothetical protein
MKTSSQAVDSATMPTFWVLLTKNVGIVELTPGGARAGVIARTLSLGK